MNAAVHILLSLDAAECLASFDERGGAPGIDSPFGSEVESPVIRHAQSDDFGTILGQQSVAELQDLMTLWAGRMAQMTSSYGALSPAWKAKDLPGWTDWTSDWAALQKRYDAALTQADLGVAGAALNVFEPNSMIAAQGEYDMMNKAMRQCYPPDGCPVQKGDWDDLFDRLTKAAATVGGAAPVDHPPQPKATDVDGSLFAASAPVDLGAQLSGAQAPTSGPLPASWVKPIQNAGTGSLGTLEWVATHKTALIVLGVALAGGLLLLELGPVIKLALLPLKAAKGAGTALLAA